MSKAPRYPLCVQTVTLYHPDETTRTVVRTLLEGVFLDRRVKMNHTETGQQQAQAFLLVIPDRAGRLGREYLLVPGDRVFDGVGPELSWEEWPAFVPAVRDGICCVQYVDPKTMGGQPCHVEAGGWWTRSGGGAHSLTN